MSEAFDVNNISTFGAGSWDYLSKIWQILVSSRNGSFPLSVSDLAPPDPLEGYPFFNRFQTHSGNKTALGNLYVDSAKTTPTPWVEGSLIGGFDGTFGITGTMTQNSVSRIPVLRFWTDGTPYASFEGISSAASLMFYYLPDQSSLTQGELFVCFFNRETSTFAKGDTIFTMSDQSPDDPNSYVPFSGDGDIYDTFGTTVRKGPISAIPIRNLTNTFFTYNASSKTNEWRNAVNGSELSLYGSNTAGFRTDPTFGAATSGSIWPGGGLIALFIFNRVLTPTERATVNTYINTLHP
jgi:hypothetical protein